MGIEGWARIVDVQHFPEIKAGKGNLITSTFTRFSSSLLIIRVDEQPEPVQVTTSHVIFSVTRNDWVQASQLQVGEFLRTSTGSSRITSLQALSGTYQVYNLEVEGAHTYFVGVERILVHNTCTLAANKAAGKAWEMKMAASHLPGMKVAPQVTLRVSTPTGAVDTRVDELVRVGPGKYLIGEGKASLTANLTKNQAIAFPLLANGAVAEVRGNNANAMLGLVSGSKISIQTVIIVRPSGVEVQ
ncbi:hypothetical protein DB346_02195 [Verrucomicrobia bacterium LW23]|nr:hypothetical protein DB346_02195 [Verrucomicrobia bacterium LW23]